MIEDDEYFPQLFVKLMSSRGHQVTHFSDGKQGFNHFVARYDDYDIIVCDGALPSMDGIKIVREIRNFEKFSKIPIIACSSMFNRDMMDEGANDWMDIKQINCNSHPSIDYWEQKLQAAIDFLVL